MKVSYTVNYSGVVEIPNEEWDQQTKADYEDDLGHFAFTFTQEEIGAWKGLTIDSITEKP